MNSDLRALIERFGDLHVLVIGEAMLDSFLAGPTRGICREAPVPTVWIEKRRDAPGGAGNTAVTLRRLGAQVSFLSVVGDDDDGARLRECLSEQGVDGRFVHRAPYRRTIAKRRLVADAQLVARFDQGSTEPVDGKLEALLLDELSALFPAVDAVIVSDYAAGIMTPRLLHRLGRLQANTPRILVGDSKRLLAYRGVGLTAIKPNYGEAVSLLDAQAPAGRPRAEWMAEQGERLLDIVQAPLAVVTLDCDGALIFERGSTPYRTYGRAVPQSQAAGAGDSFVSAFTLALAAGAHTTTAADIAAAAAGIAVGGDGTASVGREELREHFAVGDKYIVDRERLRQRAQRYRETGKRVVFTNGCFDLLHRGHVTYLSRAKALGDVLIVGVNGDTSVARLKGPTRPINSLEDRVQVLAALSCIDHIVSFDEDTAEDLVGVIRPDVFVKGGDYTPASLPEAPLVQSLGGRVEILSYLPDRSTTRIIQHIRGASGAAAHEDSGDVSAFVDARSQPVVR